MASTMMLPNTLHCFVWKLKYWEWKWLYNVCIMDYLGLPFKREMFSDDCMIVHAWMWHCLRSKQQVYLGSSKYLLCRHWTSLVSEFDIQQVYLPGAMPNLLSTLLMKLFLHYKCSLYALILDDSSSLELNGIGDKGAIALADALRVNHSLKTLKWVLEKIGVNSYTI